MSANGKGLGATTEGVSAPDEACAPVGGDDAPACHFRLAPPRHFTYPALLLLLAEEPRHGYRLVEGLRRLGLGPVSRPSVYRALADLEGDGLLESWSAAPTAGSTRHMYGLSDAGRERLDEWMEVVARERDGLDRVVDRFVRWRDDSAECEGDAG
ncbi:PadR family transcriptional regulator [Iamia sp.]|uniref:PadR family transcriptional regulator n=1 Tax=Iamia sp. TaxID=2722710 RepID=UPI002C97CC86|nr:helix-turn-helix transcriptional regulator [Iamia sp.]HXH59052.1 helix-turn-helix transcriptional regulator [Iamia sp.]